MTVPGMSEAIFLKSVEVRDDIFDTLAKAILLDDRG
jgi:hypothetical protein